MPQGTTVNVLPSSDAQGGQPQQGKEPMFLTAISPEGYKVYERLVDSDALYLRELTRLLFCADLIKTQGAIDPDSPVAGYSIIKIGGAKWKPNINLNGYKTLSDSILLFMNEALSTTETDPKSFDLDRFCLSATMSILDMLYANWEEWEFYNPMLLGPLGLAVWRNMVAIGNRSHHGGRMMRMLFNPAVFQSQNNQIEERPKSRWQP